MSPLEWELAWIDANRSRYDSPMHAEAVKRNIEKRYEIARLSRENSELKAKIKELTK